MENEHSDVSTAWVVKVRSEGSTHCRLLDRAFSAVDDACAFAVQQSLHFDGETYIVESRPTETVIAEFLEGKDVTFRSFEQTLLGYHHELLKCDLKELLPLGSLWGYALALIVAPFVAVGAALETIGSLPVYAGVLAGLGIGIACAAFCSWVSARLNRLFHIWMARLHRKRQRTLQGLCRFVSQASGAVREYVDHDGWQ